ncbi:MAG: hypothetical protein KatS3mg023_0751 [Armatimonadota bacterium]|nr:MAG: hypothetical protein KatS3mg023_0751 [Armatimonadota bacterium]
MNKQISQTTAIIVIAVVVVLVVVVGWYMMNRPKKLSYPPNFNPAMPPTTAPGAPAGSVGR